MAEQDRKRAEAARAWLAEGERCWRIAKDSWGRTSVTGDPIRDDEIVEVVPASALLAAEARATEAERERDRWEAAARAGSARLGRERRRITGARPELIGPTPEKYERPHLTDVLSESLEAKHRLAIAESQVAELREALKRLVERWEKDGDDYVANCAAELRAALSDEAKLE